jgi:membrane-associated phospholipid phosphatase
VSPDAERPGAVSAVDDDPAADAFQSAVARFDAWFDQALNQVRGHPVADRVFYTASAFGDWSMIWHLVGAGRAALQPARLPDAARLSAILGAESVLVNQGVKRLFKRGRPEFEGTRPHRMRTPSTTSFPSGHASAAFCAAAILSGEEPALAFLWYGLAATVALSRPYVHIHHASDMVGGAVAGYVIGRAARALWPS